MLQHNEIVLASDGGALDLLKLEFPELPSYELPSYDISYKHNSMAANMILQAPKIRRAIIDERLLANRIAKQLNIDIIISDNRFGFRSENTKNIYITHQIQVLTANRLSSIFATKIHAHLYRKFDLIWIPDEKGSESLAGELSQAPMNLNHEYIGCISRLEYLKSEIKYDILVILSGPEPKRTELEDILVNSLDLNKRICLVRGTNAPHSIMRKGITIVNFAESKTLSKLIAESTHIVCRSGYTSIMDLASLGRGATLIPTPGQTEQEYLAKYLDGKNGFQIIDQRYVGRNLF